MPASLCSDFIHITSEQAIHFAGIRTFRSVGSEKCEIRLKKLALLDHILIASSFCHNRLSIHWEKGLDHFPLPGESGKQLLSGASLVRRLVLIVGLLRDRPAGDKQKRCNRFSHNTNHNTKIASTSCLEDLNKLRIGDMCKTNASPRQKDLTRE